MFGARVYCISIMTSIYPSLAHRFKEEDVYHCQTLSHLSSSGLQTWIERLLPDVKKQPLGITDNVLLPF